MTAAKIAITIPAEVLEAAKKEVEAGHAASLSAFVSEAVDEKRRRNELAALLAELEAKHGSPSKSARAWAKKSPGAIVLDAGALIAFERADPRMRALLREVIREGTRPIVPAAVLGQVWRDGACQVLLRALLSGPTTEVPPLDRVLAEAAGVLCGRSKTSDVVDASVVLVARATGAVVLSSDRGALHHLDPALPIQSI